MSGKLRDPVRDFVRNHIQLFLTADNSDLPTFKTLGLPEGVDHMKVTPVTPQGTRISFFMKSGGPRHFWVKVSEEWLYIHSQRGLESSSMSKMYTHTKELYMRYCLRIMMILIRKDGT